MRNIQIATKGEKYCPLCERTKNIHTKEEMQNCQAVLKYLENTSATRSKGNKQGGNGKSTGRGRGNEGQLPASFEAEY